MWIFEYVIKIYLLIIVSIILHETGHLLGVKLLNLKYFKLYLGKSLFVIDNEKFAFSLFCISGSVKMDEDELLSKNKYMIALLFLLGPIVSLFLFILGFQLNHIVLKLVAVVYNGVGFSLNMIPIIKGTDMNHLISILKKKRISQ